MLLGVVAMLSFARAQQAVCSHAQNVRYVNQSVIWSPQFTTEDAEQAQLVREYSYMLWGRMYEQQIKLKPESPNPDLLKGG